MTRILHGDDFRDAVSPLAGETRPVVICLCAEWCGTCRDYRTGFAALAARFQDHVFVWLDVEDDADIVGDLDIETFPTLMLMQGDDLLFGGVLLPHLQHLDRLITTLSDRRALAENEYSPVARKLRGGLANAR